MMQIDKKFTAKLGGIEKILLSCYIEEVFYKVGMFKRLKRKFMRKKLVVTSEQIFILDEKLNNIES